MAPGADRSSASPTPRVISIPVTNRSPTTSRRFARASSRPAVSPWSSRVISRVGEDLMKPSSMLYRNLLAMEIEESVRSQPLDAIVVLAACDKSIPGALMGAFSTNVPCLLVVSGSMRPVATVRGGRRIGTGTDLWRMWDERRRRRSQRRGRGANLRWRSRWAREPATRCGTKPHRWAPSAKRSAWPGLRFDVDTGRRPEPPRTSRAEWDNASWRSSQSGTSISTPSGPKTSRRQRVDGARRHRRFD